MMMLFLGDVVGALAHAIVETNVHIAEANCTVLLEVDARSISAPLKLEQAQCLAMD